MTAFFHHLSYDFRTGLRDRSLLLMNYLFPLVFYAMMGALMTGVNPAFTETLIPAMIVVAIMSGGLLSLPNPVVGSREAGIFRSFKINGVPALSIITIPVVSSLLHVTLISAVITLTAGPFFKASQPVDLGYFVLVGLLATFAMAGAGMLIGVISSNARSTVLLAQLIFLPSMMLGGLMMPTSSLPETLRRIALALPATHAMNAWNALAMGKTAFVDPTWSLLVLLSGGLIAFGLAALLFNWDSRNRQGRLPNAVALLAFVPYILSVIFLG